MTISDTITAAITARYQPAQESQTEGVEYLSTIELINQFEAVADVDKNTMAEILSEIGFTITFVFDEYKWVLFPY
jgi:hypothetical protein